LCVFFQYPGEFALIDISWMTIIIGMLANAVALPLNLLIALLFRRSMVRLIVPVISHSYLRL